MKSIYSKTDPDQFEPLQNGKIGELVVLWSFEEVPLVERLTHYTYADAVSRDEEELKSLRKLWISQTNAMWARQVHNGHFVWVNIPSGPEHPGVVIDVLESNCYIVLLDEKLVRLRNTFLERFDEAQKRLGNRGR